MAQSETTTTLNANLKNTYADVIENLIPENAILTKRVDFVAREKRNGRIYNAPVIVANCQGFTYGAPNSGVITLNAPVAMTMQNAEVEGYQLAVREQVDYEIAARGSNPAAFKETFGLVIENMIESSTARLEISMRYGQTPFCIADFSVNASATTTTVTMTVGSFAVGLWSGLENAQVQFYTSSGTGSLVSSGANSVFVVGAIDPDARTVLFTGTATGITALDAALGSGDCGVFFLNSKTEDMNGLKKILSNTGTLFSINAGTYSLWRANTYSAGSAQLTFQKVLNGVQKAVARGLKEKVIVLVNPITWGNLASDLAALRRFDGSYKSKVGEMGVGSIKYYGQNGEIEIVSDLYMWPSQAYILPLARLERIGAQELSFRHPGSKGGEIFFDRQDELAVELRAYSNQAIFLNAPAKATLITDIVNS